MKKGFCALVMIVSFIVSTSITSWAGEWKEFDGGWWYQEAEGSYLASGWHWIDTKCYYFTPEGMCLINTTTPDGYQVDETGAWVVDGVVQIQIPIEYSKWIGRYVADDGQIITVNSADENFVDITMKGYSEEGWYTKNYYLFYSNGTKTEATHIDTFRNGEAIKTIYTLTDSGIEVTVSPYGGWAQGSYIRQ